MTAQRSPTATSSASSSTQRSATSAATPLTSRAADTPPLTRRAPPREQTVVLSATPGGASEFPGLGTLRVSTLRHMTIQRMDHVVVVVDDLAAAIIRRARYGDGRRGIGVRRGTVGGPRGGAGGCPCRHRPRADAGRPRPTRADEVPPAG